MNRELLEYEIRLVFTNGKLRAIMGEKREVFVDEETGRKFPVNEPVADLSLDELKEIFSDVDALAQLNAALEENARLAESNKQLAEQSESLTVSLAAAKAAAKDAERWRDRARDVRATLDAMPSPETINRMVAENRDLREQFARYQPDAAKEHAQ